MAGLAAAPAARGEGEAPYRLRLTETSVTEQGRISDCDFKVQTRGYGFTVIAPIGVGINYTELTTYGDGPSSLGWTDARLRHSYVDVSYTYGDRWLVTTGASYLVHGEIRLDGDKGLDAGSKASGESLFLGPGFGIGWFEAYWIYRRNWVDYQLKGHDRTLASEHFQLGLGAKLAL